MSQIVKQYKKKLKLPGGTRKCITVTITREGKEPLKTYFGGIPLIRNPKAVIADLPTPNWKPTRSELVKRLLADVCEICGATGHIRTGSRSPILPEVKKIKPIAPALNSEPGSPIRRAWRQPLLSHTRGGSAQADQQRSPHRDSLRQSFSKRIENLPSFIVPIPQVSSPNGETASLPLLRKP